MADKDIFGDLFKGFAGGKEKDTFDDAQQKMTIGLMAKRIEALEEQVINLTTAMLVLINSKDKKGSAIIPKHVRYRKPSMFVEWQKHEDDSKQIAIIKIELKE